MTTRLAAPMVSFVGAGPGDPNLITRKGWQVLGQAEIVLFDALLDVDGFRQSAPSARWIHVGKRAGQLSTTQSFITKSIVNFALRGYRVVRLKGGDPAVFGRLTEEINACRSADIDVEIIPGVTAASSCAAELGVSLTQRDVSRSVTFLTPRTSHSGTSTSEHWVAPALHSDTVVFYMASDDLPEIARTLLAQGKPPQTPVAVVESASRGVTKRVLTLDECVRPIPAANGGPVTILMGDVVRLAIDAPARSSDEDKCFHVGIK